MNGETLDYGLQEHFTSEATIMQHDLDYTSFYYKYEYS